MFEVELKVSGDHDRVRERLRERDAEHLGAVHQADTYYDAPHRDFAATDEALRIRREQSLNAADGEARITYKGPLLEAQSKSREEHETGVDDGAVASDILASLGFDPVATVEKERERWRVDEFTVTLDDVAGVGRFVEVETESETADITAAREAAVDLLETLGLDPDEQIRTSYLGLLLDDA
jgi:adenylate cyclase class 2